MEKLKVCPFCGGEPSTALRIMLGKVEFTVFCRKCYISKTMGLKPEFNEATFKEVAEGMEEAIQAWNVRF